MIDLYPSVAARLLSLPAAKQARIEERIREEGLDRDRASRYVDACCWRWRLAEAEAREARAARAAREQARIVEDARWNELHADAIEELSALLRKDGQFAHLYRAALASITTGLYEWAPPFAAQEGITEANAYQRKRRGMLRLLRERPELGEVFQRWEEK